MSIEAMKQALEALETLNSGDSYKTHNAATALRQAIAEAEQPWVKTYAGGKPNYTTPIEKQVRTHTPEDIKKIESKWVGLSRDEVLDIEETTTHPLEFYRAIEAKLKEKNHEH